jgi:hypothetical protein
MQIYVDGRLQTTVQAASINISLPMNAGQRRITVKVWDSTGANSMSQRYVTVTGSTPSSGRQYYVSPSGNDANTGSASAPWRTLSRADRSARPGDTVYVASGTYPGASEAGGRLKTVASGTPSARIRWIAESKWGAKLISVQTGNNAVWWSQGNYVDIQGFDLSGKGALGIYNTGSHTRIVGNHVHHIPATGCPSNGGAGIHNGNYSASDNDVIGNWVHNIGDYSRPCTRVHGIYHANLRGHIYNNVTFRNQGWGIHLWHAATNIVISSNTIFANGNGGILIGGVSGEYSGGSGSNDRTIVSNNIIYRNGLAGGGFGLQEYGDVGRNNQYVRNVVSQNGPGNWSTFANVASGTVTATPTFINYKDDGTGNYQLTSGSCAVGAGSNLGAPGNDYNGGKRPTASRWDAGAFQHGAAAGAYPQP